MRKVKPSALSLSNEELIERPRKRIWLVRDAVSQADSGADFAANATFKRDGKVSHRTRSSPHLLSVLIIKPTTMATPKLMTIEHLIGCFGKPPLVLKPSAAPEHVVGHERGDQQVTDWNWRDIREVVARLVEIDKNETLLAAGQAIELDVRSHNDARPHNLIGHDKLKQVALLHDSAGARPLKQIHDESRVLFQRSPDRSQFERRCRVAVAETSIPSTRAGDAAQATG
ncbi:MAG: hypothetical protein HEQ23_01935 [Tepidisphaera sp.]